MKDRGGRDYVWLTRTERRPLRQVTTTRVCLLSPTRQLEKALGLSGRQRRIARKAIRRAAKAAAREPFTIYLEGEA